MGFAVAPSRLKSGWAAAPQVVCNAVQRVGGGKGADSLSRGGERAMADVDTAQEASSRWAKDAIPVAAEEVPPFTFVLVKLASRCNINCTYCYWFRDAEVRSEEHTSELQS